MARERFNPFPNLDTAAERLQNAFDYLQKNSLEKVVFNEYRDEEERNLAWREYQATTGFNIFLYVRLVNQYADLFVNGLFAGFREGRFDERTINIELDFNADLSSREAREALNYTVNYFKFKLIGTGSRVANLSTGARIPTIKLFNGNAVQKINDGLAAAV